MRPGVEDEKLHSQPRQPKRRDQPADASCQQTAIRHRPSDRYREQPEADNHQHDERPMHPNQLPQQRIERPQLGSPIEYPRHQSAGDENSQLQHAADSHPCFRGCSCSRSHSKGPHRREQRQDDAVNKRRMKEHRGRQHDYGRGEKPPRQPAVQLQPPPQRRMLDEHAGTLYQKVRRGQPEPATGRQRDGHIMHDARGEERGQQRPPRAPASDQRPIDQFVGRLREREVPAPAPKFSERRRPQRPIHNRPGVEAELPPGKAQKIEQPEMQDQNDADPADPAGQPGPASAATRSQTPSIKAPAANLPLADNHSIRFGSVGRAARSKNPRASMPGQANR